ncbi:MAG: hypothetical protein EU539_02320 [Promethearchaeota archaeon]|nr:MAG: hypothetical protein EU539_02320 [Candidatus Lokiarchaeota archaeon]
MPKGCFVILLINESDYRVLGYHVKDEINKIEITSDLFLRLNLDHSKNEFNILKLKDHQIESYKHEFEGKLKRKALGLIVGILLKEGDDPEKLRTSLKNAASNIEQIDFLDLSKDDFETTLKQIYRETIETLTDVLDVQALKESIINRTKEMLSGGKKQRKIAQELLERIEDDLHVKISEHYKSAEDALDNSDYDKASKLFLKAAEIAEELYEYDLAKSLEERAKLSNNIPDLTKKRDLVVKEAKNALRNDNFHSAYLFYLRAAELSKQLMQPEKEEEYSFKSKALQDIYLFEEKLRKKKKD